ncbi:MAG TPA: ABC transporter ATP-binding protein [Xanthobacteraceae bacterium]|jgi:ABC-type polysaccharide/polyol phosphate transport system ATPase subunit
MAELILTDVGVEFVVYHGKARSLKQLALQKTVGGLIGHKESGKTTVRALQSVNLVVRDGDRVALLGHNGAGKTTLLRVVGGIYHPTSGAIHRHGRCIPLFEIGIGFDDEATGHENIMLRGLTMGLTRREIAKNTEWIADFSGLGEFLDLPVRTYSTGMLLRLMFSIATSIETDIILMDEWIATGDQDFIGKADRRLHEMVEKTSIMLLATHNLELVRQLCNRVIVLTGGNIIADGSTEDVLPAYAAGSPDLQPT